MKKMIDTIEEDFLERTKLFEKPRKRARKEYSSKPEFNPLSDWIGGSTKTRSYKPLFDRPTCGNIFLT